jgi:hypothetical protein
MVLLCLMLLGGCLGRSSGSQNDELPDMIAHIDSVRQFTIEYPAYWQREKTTPSSVTWSGKSPRAMVMTMRGAMEGATNWRQLAPAALVITAQEQVPLAGGSARQLLGHTADRLYLFYLLGENGRAAILEFSTTTDNFDALRPVFKQMAESFRILE